MKFDMKVVLKGGGEGSWEGVDLVPLTSWDQYYKTIFAVIDLL